MSQHRREIRHSAALIDGLVGVFILAWATVGWGALIGDGRVFAVATGRDPGPALMPVAVLAVLSLGGLGILAAALLRVWRGTPAPPDAAAPDFPAPTGRQHLFALALLASLLIYPSVMRWIGYAAATLIFAFLWILVLTPRHQLTGRARSLAALGVAAGAAGAITAIVYGGFVVVIRAPLP